MRAFLRQAEDILDVAVEGDSDSSGLAIVIDRQGGMRMLDPQGWSLPALCAEFGAAAVYAVERRGRTVRVEGWGGGERCLIQRNLNPRRPSDLPGMCPVFGEQRVLAAHRALENQAVFLDLKMASASRSMLSQSAVVISVGSPLCSPSSRSISKRAS